MYLAKQAGKNRYRVFAPAAQDVVRSGWIAGQNLKKSAVVCKGSPS
jgi:hypothetical protein